MKQIIYISALLALTSCGGGGGGSSSNDSFAGTWRGQMALSSDGCGANPEPIIDSTMIVNQNGALVAVDGPQGDVFSGTATDIDLKATAQRNFDCAGTLGVATLGVEMLRGQGSGYDADEVAAIYTITAACVETGESCTARYLGTLARD